MQTKNYIEKMIDLEAHLKQLCTDIAPYLDNCTFQDKKDAYTYLDLKVVATPEGADIKGYLDPSSIKAVFVPTYHWTNMGITTWR